MVFRIAAHQQIPDSNHINTTGIFGVVDKVTTSNKLL